MAITDEENKGFGGTRSSFFPNIKFDKGFKSRHSNITDPIGALKRLWSNVSYPEGGLQADAVTTPSPYQTKYKAATPWMDAYLSATKGGAFNAAQTTTGFGKKIQEASPFTETSSPFFPEVFDMNKLSETPLGRGNAQNSAQRGNTYAEALKAAQEDIQGAQGRAKGIAEMTGFNRETGRDYEPVTQGGEIVGMQAKRMSNEDITQPELDRKSWVSPEYLDATKSGSVFTPRLDKFKAMQDPAAMVHSWDRPESAYAGKTNSEMRQIAKDLRGGESNVGRVLGAQTMTTGRGVQTRYTPTNITSSQDAVRKASEAGFNLASEKYQTPEYTSPQTQGGQPVYGEMSSEKWNALKGQQVPSGQTVVTEWVVGPDGKEMVKMKGTSSAPLQKRTDQVGPEPDEET